MTFSLSLKKARLNLKITDLYYCLRKIKMHGCCIFKLLYSKQIDDFSSGMNVAIVRTDLRKFLSSEAPANTDMVVPIPESRLFYTIDYSDASRISMIFWHY